MISLKRVPSALENLPIEGLEVVVTWVDLPVLGRLGPGLKKSVS